MLYRIFTGTFSECLAQALAPSCNCNSENVLRIATNSHRTFIEKCYDCWNSSAPSYRGVYDRAEEILNSQTKSMEMLWARLQRPGRVGANVAKNIRMNILRMIGQSPSAQLQLQF